MRKEVPEVTPSIVPQLLCPSDALPQFDYSSVSPQVAKFLKEQAVRIQKYSTRAVIQIGKDLASAKHYLSHGAFLRWVENEVGIAARTAQGYMRVASWAADKGATVALLPPTALYALSATGVPKEFVEDVLRMAKEGERIQVSSLRAQLKSMRTARQLGGSGLRKESDRTEEAVERSSAERTVSLLSHAVEIVARALSADEFAEVHAIMTSKRVLDNPDLPRMLERAFAPYEPVS